MSPGPRSGLAQRSAHSPDLRAGPGRSEATHKCGTCLITSSEGGRSPEILSPEHSLELQGRLGLQGVPGWVIKVIVSSPTTCPSCSVLLVKDLCAPHPSGMEPPLQEPQGPQGCPHSLSACRDPRGGLASTCQVKKVRRTLEGITVPTASH